MKEIAKKYFDTGNEKQLTQSLTHYFGKQFCKVTGLEEWECDLYHSCKANLKVLEARIAKGKEYVAAKPDDKRGVALLNLLKVDYGIEKAALIILEEQVQLNLEAF